MNDGRPKGAHHADGTRRTGQDGRPTSRERLREAGHTVIGYDMNAELSDAESLVAMVEQIESQPRGLCG